MEVRTLTKKFGAAHQQKGSLLILTNEDKNKD